METTKTKKVRFKETGKTLKTRLQDLCKLSEKHDADLVKCEVCGRDTSVFGKKINMGACHRSACILNRMRETC